MALTQLQKLELNKRVDKILHAPASSPVGGQQLEMVFAADMTADRAFVEEAFRESAAALKAHDRIFQNVRSNVVYWGSGLCIIRISIKKGFICWKRNIIKKQYRD